MSRKFRNIVWMFFLFMATIPAGYLMVFTNDPRQATHEMAVTMIVGPLAILIVAGVIGIIIYAILKDRKSADPAKPALIVYQIIVFTILGLGLFEHNGAMQQLDREDFLDGLEEGLCETFAKLADQEPDLAGHVSEVCHCVYTFIEHNDALIDEMMTDEDPLTFAQRSPEMKEIIMDCYNMYLDQD